MVLEQLKVYNFSNYDTEEVDWDPNLNIITGLNGMGKTNMLDAIYYLCIGKSYFKTYDRHVVQEGQAGFSVAGRFRINDQIEVPVLRVEPSKSKVVEKSGKVINKLSDYIGTYPCVIIAPSDITLLLEGSIERRKFMDNTLMQLDAHYGEQLLKYNRVLKQRNAMLSSFAEKRTFNKDLLESISVQMLEPATIIFNKRAEMIRRLSPLFSDFYQRISGGREQCHISYRSHLQNKSLQDWLDETLEKDRVLTRTTRGIHRDDLVFKINGHTLKNFASQGQVKSFVMAIKLSQFSYLASHHKRTPLLLLDDVFDKLDRERVSQLLEVVSEKPFGQVFITDTNLNRVRDILNAVEVGFKAYLVSEGTIKEEDV